jgi:hypothetical protein
MSSFESAVESAAGGVAERCASATASGRFCSGFGEAGAKLNVKAMLTLGVGGGGGEVRVAVVLGGVLYENINGPKARRANECRSSTFKL